MILAPTTENIEKVVARLKAGEVVALPTETVYGLGANAFNENAVKKIYEIKGRPTHNPLIAHIASIDQLELVTTPEAIERLQAPLRALKSFFPGPLSIVIPRNNRLARSVYAGLSTIAVRIPNHAIMQTVLSHCEFPIAAPSANPSNYISPTTAQHVADQLSDRISYILDGGPCHVGIESTILDLAHEQPRILRQGQISAEELSKALSLPLDTLLRSHPSDAPDEVTAPGMLSEHYSPRTPMQLLSDSSKVDLNKRIGLISLNRERVPRAAFTPIKHSHLSENGDLEEVSRNLFKTMREFDTLGLDLIVVEDCPPIGIGRAIMDRLTRASAGSRGM